MLLLILITIIIPYPRISTFKESSSSPSSRKVGRVNDLIPFENEGYVFTSSFIIFAGVSVLVLSSTAYARGWAQVSVLITSSQGEISDACALQKSLEWSVLGILHDVKKLNVLNTTLLDLVTEAYDAQS